MHIRKLEGRAPDAGRGEGVDFDSNRSIGPARHMGDRPTPRDAARAGPASNQVRGRAPKFAGGFPGGFPGLLCERPDTRGASDGNYSRALPRARAKARLNFGPRLSSPSGRNRMDAMRIAP